MPRMARRISDIRGGRNANAQPQSTTRPTRSIAGEPRSTNTVEGTVQAPIRTARNPASAAEGRHQAAATSAAAFLRRKPEAASELVARRIEFSVQQFRAAA